MSAVSEVKTAVLSNFNKMKFSFVQHKPEIKLGAGMVLSAAGVVGMCRATVKSKGAWDARKMVLSEIDDKLKKDPEYSKKDAGKDVMNSAKKAVWETVKAYAVPVTTYVVGQAFIVSSHVEMSSRNANLAAAYSAVMAGYSTLANRVETEYGVEAREKLTDGFETVTEEVEDETGEKTTKVHMAKVKDATGPYTILWGPHSRYFTGHPIIDLAKLKECEQFANAKLCAKGYLFVNEVLDMGGFEPIAEGQVDGWIYEDGDFVSFGLDPLAYPATKSFLDGDESQVWLHLNARPNILRRAKMERKNNTIKGE